MRDLTMGVLRRLAHAPMPKLPRPMSRALVRRLVATRRFAAGLRERSVTVDRFTIPYLEGGTGEPLVLLHGFGDFKESFVETVRHLTRSHRVILPDLPGFGDASAPHDHTYTVSGFVHLLARALERMDVERMHLGGNSMGGTISVALALEHPERVHSLTLLSPGGIPMPVASPTKVRMDAGDNAWVMDSVDDYREFMKLVLEVIPPLPDPVVEFLAEEAIERGPLNEKIMQDLLAEAIDLSPRLGEIGVPTLVAWGEHDRVLDPSLAPLFHQGIRGSRLTMLDGVGHSPQYEVPDRTGQLIAGFLAEHA